MSLLDTQYDLRRENEHADCSPLDSGTQANRSLSNTMSSHQADFDTCSRDRQTTDVVSTLSSPQSLPAPSEPMSPVKVTVIGACRFLDNFGPLFGCSISHEGRNREQSALKSVIRVFALHCSPLSSGAPAGSVKHGESDAEVDNRITFKSAWFDAFSGLTASKCDCSFLRLYAVFLFHMVPLPEEARTDPTILRSSTQLLDHGLVQLQRLEVLVNRFCSNLPCSSLYQRLVSCCFRLIRWYGYVRDTIASLGFDRKCQLQDARLGTNREFGIQTFSFRPWLN